MLIFVSVHCFWCTERCPEWDATVRIRVQLLHQVTSFYCCVRLLESSKEELQNKGLKNARLLASTHRPSSVLQKLKLCTIDDCSVGGLNCSVGLPEKLRVHSIDVLASMLRRALEISGGFAKCGWLGRTYDLRLAYRQFGMSPVSRELLRIAVNKPGVRILCCSCQQSSFWGSRFSSWVPPLVYGAVDHWACGLRALLVCLLRRLPDCHE